MSFAAFLNQHIWPNMNFSLIFSLFLCLERAVAWESIWERSLIHFPPWAHLFFILFTHTHTHIHTPTHTHTHTTLSNGLFFHFSDTFLFSLCLSFCHPFSHFSKLSLCLSWSNCVTLCLPLWVFLTLSFLFAQVSLSLSLSLSLCISTHLHTCQLFCFCGFRRSRNSTWCPGDKSRETVATLGITNFGPFVERNL